MILMLGPTGSKTGPTTPGTSAVPHDLMHELRTSVTALPQSKCELPTCKRSWLPHLHRSQIQLQPRSQIQLPLLSQIQLRLLVQ